MRSYASSSPQFLRVLLVEDSKALAGRLSDVLHQMETAHLVGIADTEEAALAWVRQGSVDVIILDLRLRQGSGFGVMRTLSHASWKPQIIVLTNYDLPEYKNAALALGASHFLDKARDYARLPGLLNDISEAQHSNH